ncbi:sugar phosphate nucleotidyltransferase [Rhodococcus sp. HS-D2]|uniref:sugar phosphate nucleotidyltransferase n=1 Tax=Rhodococcus sp. HS-D2 TaxID=1384636 RepID=UPI000A91CA2C|nr:sugar phosphate nucleotidyltransferase [Rhodococcus sp. HS-D2]
MHINRIAGIILAGGTGTRLAPTTRVVNKHLLPIYDRPAISFSLDVMRDCRAESVVIVGNAADAATYDSIHNWLGYQDLPIRTVVQDRPDGVAGAIACGYRQLQGTQFNRFIVMLGDTLYIGPTEWTRDVVDEVRDHGASVAVTEHPNPRDFGVVDCAADGSVLQIREKIPANGPRLVCTGLYGFDDTLGDRLQAIKPSRRGELEVTSLLNSYVTDSTLTAVTIPQRVEWFDIGTPDRLLDASMTYRTKVHRRSGTSFETMGAH